LRYNFLFSFYPPPPKNKIVNIFLLPLYYTTFNNQDKGELPDYWPAQGYIDAYVEINKKVCAEMGAIHLDSRSLFKSVILEKKRLGRTPKDLKFFVGKHWPIILEENVTYGGIFTYDGQHSNFLGTQLLVDMIANTVALLPDVWGSVEEVHQIVKHIKLENAAKGDIKGSVGAGKSSKKGKGERSDLERTLKKLNTKNGKLKRDYKTKFIRQGS
jgi:hypothetical protein